MGYNVVTATVAMLGISYVGFLISFVWVSLSYVEWRKYSLFNNSDASTLEGLYLLSGIEDVIHFNTPVGRTFDRRSLFSDIPINENFVPNCLKRIRKVSALFAAGCGMLFISVVSGIFVPISRNEDPAWRAYVSKCVDYINNFKETHHVGFYSFVWINGAIFVTSLLFHIYATSVWADLQIIPDETLTLVDHKRELDEIATEFQQAHPRLREFQGDGITFKSARYKADGYIQFYYYASLICPVVFVGSCLCPVIAWSLLPPFDKEEASSSTSMSSKFTVEPMAAASDGSTIAFCLALILLLI